MGKLEDVVSLAKRRGFVYPGSEIYGGLANTYDYGPLGAELLNNIRNEWWNTFVHGMKDVVGLESQIFMHPKVWEASGHLAGFHDPLIDCRNCNSRYRADHLISGQDSDMETDQYDNQGLEKLIKDKKIKCPRCGKNDWTSVRDFNLMFKTHRGPTSDAQSVLFLRPETAQGMFVQFKNITNSTRQKVPFGIAQIGKAFRNEITKGKYIFRTLEFQQMEIEYFVKEEGWENAWGKWSGLIENWYGNVLKIPKEKLRWKPHHPDKLSHYARKAEDYQYKYKSLGFDEVSGLHYRTDFDLKTHQEHSGEKNAMKDEQTGEEFIPHVVEATFGLNRNMLMMLDNSYEKNGERTLLKIPPKLAPYKLAVFPLLANKSELLKKAGAVYDLLSSDYHCSWDDRGNIGKRYFSQDEIGTPWCVTVDFETLKDDTVTVRDRDTTKQERVSVDKLDTWIKNKLTG
jgi:glycyl-tRNA synthetase